MNDNASPLSGDAATLASVHEALVAIYEAAGDPEKVRRLAAEAL